MAGSKRLYTGRPGTSNSTLVATQTVKTWIKSIVLHNNTTIEAVVTLNLVPSAGAAGLDNEFIQLPIGGRGIVILNDVATLEIGDTIQGLQTTSGAISIIISGVEVI